MNHANYIGSLPDFHHEPAAEPGAPYEHQAFPSWRYHREEAPKLIHSQEEHDELGEEWADTPAAFDVAEPAAVAEKKSRKK